MVALVAAAAEGVGLGGVYIGMIMSQDIRKTLDVQEYVFQAGLVTLRYPGEQPDLRPRLPLEAVVHRDQYWTVGHRAGELTCAESAEVMRSLRLLTMVDETAGWWKSSL